MDKLKVCDDMRTMKFLPSIWDMIEESPQFSDEDRRHISDFLYQHAHKTSLANTKVKPSAQPHGNNWNATASFCAAIYFHKYYPELEISRRLQQVIEQQGHRVTLISVGDEAQVDLQSFDKIVVGASIRYGKHNREVYDFIKRNEQLLDSKPNAFFSVNVVARKPEKNQPETNPYLKKFLRQISWKPGELAVFAGKIDYPRYSFRDRLIIRFIMWMTKGPTDPEAVVEFTNWKQVEGFGRLVSNM